MFRHVGIVVNNLDKMIWFYTEILEMDVMYDQIEGGVFLNHILNSKDLSPRILKLGKNGSTIVELLFFGNCELSDKNLLTNGYTHFALTVNNTENLYQKILINNLSVINEPIVSTDNNVKVFFAKDPENNIIEFVELL
jgi:catechol 2,3-dioxygenase-like lactoylglutathione lyase family enzyme